MQHQAKNGIFSSHSLWQSVIHINLPALLRRVSIVLLAAGSMTAPAADNPVALDIGASDLGIALNALALSTSTVIYFDAALTKDKRTSGLQGEYPIAAALSQLLQDSSLQAKRQTDGSYRVVAAKDTEESVALPRVNVKSESMQESAYGPVESYVAKHSATATKTDTPIIETPQSISVISRKDMDIRNVRDVGDAVSYISGVSTGSRGETALFDGGSIKIRGFGGDGSAGNSRNGYLDGLKLSFGSSNVGAHMDPWLYERVEVFKGPTSVLFGQTQPGGIVNRVSKRPHTGMRNQIRLGSGNFDEASAAFDLGAELKGGWRFRVAGLGLKGDTQQDHSKRERQLLAPSLRWTNDTTDLTLLMLYQRDDINASVLSVLPRAAVFSNPNGRVPLSFRVGDPGFEFWDRKTWSISYLFSHRFNEALTFRQNLRFGGNKDDSLWLYRRSLNSDQRTLNRRKYRSKWDNDYLAIDNQIEWKLTTGTVKHTLLTGIDYHKFSEQYYTAGHRAGPAPPSIDIFAPVYNQIISIPTSSLDDGRTDMRRIGIYLQDQVKIGDLSLLIGGRYDKAQSSIENNLNSKTTRLSDYEFTGRVGAIYNFASGFAPYASYAESFEPIGGSAFDGSPFKPMEGKQYEVGIKYQPAGTEHLITVAAFELTQENMTTTDPVNQGYRIQTGEVQTRGVELEGKFSINDNLHVTAAYTYLNDEVTKSNTGNKGNRRTEIPKHSASLWANYSLTRGMLSGMGMGMGVRYTGKTEGDNLNTFDVPSYTLVDLAAYYDLGQSPLRLQNWRASVNVNNLFDKYYIASCRATHSCYLGRERAVRASVEYSF